ncbi:hypothetical protein Xekj_00168 [Xenorhabdus sp. KJ12.1]|nr:hypothetical protein Xekj_00168 [Xenorhabdus sp. KJ12.1]
MTGLDDNILGVKGKIFCAMLSYLIDNNYHYLSSNEK